MILFKGRLLSHDEAAQKLKALNADRERVEHQLREVEEKVDELECDISSLNLQINGILEQMRGGDLTQMLPTELLNRGWKLTEVAPMVERQFPDFWGEIPKHHGKLTILEDGDGNIVREWNHSPSLADLFEVSAK